MPRLASQLLAGSLLPRGAAVGPRSRPYLLKHPPLLYFIQLICAARRIFPPLHFSPKVTGLSGSSKNFLPPASLIVAAFTPLQPFFNAPFSLSRGKGPARLASGSLPERKIKFEAFDFLAPRPRARFSFRSSLGSEVKLCIEQGWEPPLRFKAKTPKRRWPFTTRV